MIFHNNKMISKRYRHKVLVYIAMCNVSAATVVNIGEQISMLQFLHPLTKKFLFRNALREYWIKTIYIQYLNQKMIEIFICFLYIRCGHSYHKGCQQSIGSVHVIDGEDTWVCFLCSHRKRGQYQSTRFHRSHSNRGQPKGKDRCKLSVVVLLGKVSVEVNE